MKKPKISKNRAKRFGVSKIQEIWNRCGGRCEYCGKRMVQPTSDPNTPVDIVESYYTIDHIIPTSKGGKKNDINNLRGACRECNNRKSAHLDIEYLRMHLLFEREGWPKFSYDQYSFLVSKGHCLNRLMPYKFHFEK